ncbi:MAG: hypothetical protein GX301_00125 [Gracilibacteraceae bacterium]|nr:hypothetical protein [Gracilibacteraceae bacterium]
MVRIADCYYASVNRRTCQLLERNTASMFSKPNVTTTVSNLSSKRMGNFRLGYHYPSMQLHTEGQQYIIKGFYNKGEENFIANYFLGYTDNIISIKPKKLKKLLQDRIFALESHYKRA